MRRIQRGPVRGISLKLQARLHRLSLGGSDGTPGKLLSVVLSSLIYVTDLNFAGGGARATHGLCARRVCCEHRTD